MLQQHITMEVIAQEDATSKYHVRTDAKGQALGRPIFYTEIPVCWSKDPEHNIVISAFVWGNEVQNDNPTAGPTFYKKVSPQQSAPGIHYCPGADNPS